MVYGTIRGEISTDTIGSYQDLIAQVTSDEYACGCTIPVEFYVNGIKAPQTSTFTAAGSKVVDLAVDTPTFNYCNIIAPCRIDEAGYYRLINDVEGCSSENCIIINSSNVILDGNGHYLHGIKSSHDSSFYGIYVYPINYGNITVKNFNISNFITGIGIPTVNEALVENCHISDNGNFGIFLDNSHNVTINQNNFTSNGKAPEGLIYYPSGIQFDSYSSDNIVLNNNFNGNSHAITIRTSHNNEIINNSISDSAENGIYLFDYSNNNQILSNNIFNNYQGIVLQTNNDENLIRNNNISNNFIGIRLFSGCENNQIFNNLFYNENNLAFAYCGANTWNIPKTKETNIIGGPYQGGNYWGQPNGEGFSQISPSDNDGFCIAQLLIEAGNIDFLPLHYLPPIADFNTNVTTGIVPLSVEFIDNSTYSPLNWTWNFGDGNTSTEQNPNHTYTFEGNFTVNLTVSNENGENTTVKIIQVINPNPPSPLPMANFTALPLTGNAPLLVQFNDSSSNNPIEWVWEFGDFKGSNVQNPSHLYRKEGNYTISLNVTNSFGSNVTVKTDYVTVLAPNLTPFPNCEQIPRDILGSGYYTDLNGNNRLDFNDIVLYFNHLEWITENEPIQFFDYNSNGRIDFNDLIRLFNTL